MRLADQPVIKTRKIGRYTCELSVVQITGGDAKGKFQATYYDIADPVIWGECKDTAEEAINHLDQFVDEMAKQFPILYGSN